MPYYSHGAQARHYAYDWNGLPMKGHRAAETRALGASRIDVEVQGRARFQHPLESRESLEGCCTSCSSGGPCGVGDTWPVMQSAMTGQRSVLRSGPEVLKGLAGLSRSEQTFVKLAGAAAAAWLLWRML
jgi:hypothetical protein